MWFNILFICLICKSYSMMLMEHCVECNKHLISFFCFVFVSANKWVGEYGEMWLLLEAGFRWWLRVFVSDLAPFEISVLGVGETSFCLKKTSICFCVFCVSDIWIWRFKYKFSTILWILNIKIMSCHQGWPISSGVQSLLGFLAPFEIGYNEGQKPPFEGETWVFSPAYYLTEEMFMHNGKL